MFTVNRMEKTMANCIDNLHPGTYYMVHIIENPSRQLLPSYIRGDVKKASLSVNLNRVHDIGFHLT